MGFVNLVSGGMDSTLVGIMAKEDGIEQFPLFIDYGQRAAVKEWQTCQAVHLKFDLPVPVRMDLSGFGQVILSGLTNEAMDIKESAFTPGRNLMFLLMGSSYAYQKGVPTVAIGLLSEQFSLFPDQSAFFISQAEMILATTMGKKINIMTPLFDFSKFDVVKLAKSKGVEGTYSCHLGMEQPCGACIACLEFQFPGEK